MPQYKKPKVPAHFPKGLWAGSRGRWECKINGEIVRLAKCVGPERDDEEALRQFKLLKAEAKVARMKGEEYNPHSDSLTVDQWLEAYLEDRRLSVGLPKKDHGISERTWMDEHRCKLRLSSYRVAEFGERRIGQFYLDELTSRHMALFARAMPSEWSPCTWNHHVRFWKAAEKWALEESLLFERALPRHKLFRVRSKDRGDDRVRKLFECTEVHHLYRHVAVSRPQIAAMIMLGINCGFHNIDFARLQEKHIEGEYLFLPRGKKGDAARAAWLWPETIAAIDRAKECRPDATEGFIEGATRKREHRIAHDDLLFLTYNGTPWCDPSGDRDAIGREFYQIRKETGIFREHVGFNALRHTFKSTAESRMAREAGDGDMFDWVAINWVMGHVPADTAREGAGGAYRHFKRGEDEPRVRRVCGLVRDWFIEGRPDDCETVDAKPSPEAMDPAAMAAELAALREQLAAMKSAS